MVSYHKFEGTAIPAMIVSGLGCRQLLPELLDSLSFKQVLLVTGPNVRTGSGIVAEIDSLLGHRIAGIFDRIQTHVPEALLGVAADYARKAQPDAVMSIGGGSAHDTAKAISLMLSSRRSIQEVMTRSNLPQSASELPMQFSPLPVITVPSTFSAAEVIGGGAFTEASSREKLIFGSPGLTPVLVVLDGEVVATTPRPILLASGMNAVHHCLEALYSRGSQPITDALALHALGGLISSLPRIAPDVVAPEKSDYQHTLESASLSGLTYANSWLGVGHAICHSLGGRFGLSHGGANSVIVRYSLRFNMEAAADKLRLAAASIELPAEGSDAMEKLAKCIDELTIRLGVPQTLRDLGLPEGQFDAIAHDTMKDPQISWNPRPVSFSDIVELLEQAW